MRENPTSTWMNAFVITALLLLLGCEVTKPIPSGLTVQYRLNTTEHITRPERLRYEVLWTGTATYQVTNRGVIPDMHAPFSVHFSLPEPDVLYSVYPEDTLSFNYHYYPEVPARRPRVVIFEDLNDNKAFDMNADRMIALDGAGYDRYQAIAALLDVDFLLSQLTPDDQSVFYEWTLQKYTPFLYVGASQYFSTHLYPTFETSSTEGVSHPDDLPVLDLNSAPELIMKSDLVCNRQLVKTSNSIPVEIRVDDTLDATEICADAEIPCNTFSFADPPDLETLLAEADIATTRCGWTQAGMEVIEIHQGFISCDQCYCTYDYFITYFVFHGDNIPLSQSCPEDTPLPTSLSELDPYPLAGLI
ncbi:MAG: hypothetical protein JXR76_15470 [Deltaproteobacteria bacterium]|nr:hypothetical protein [Deltaproteobacteria bacterium]